MSLCPPLLVSVWEFLSIVMFICLSLRLWFLLFICLAFFLSSLALLTWFSSKSVCLYVPLSSSSCVCVGISVYFHVPLPVSLCLWFLLFICLAFYLSSHVLLTHFSFSPSLILHLIILLFSSVLAFYLSYFALLVHLSSFSASLAFTSLFSYLI